VPPPKPRLAEHTRRLIIEVAVDADAAPVNYERLDAALADLLLDLEDDDGPEAGRADEQEAPRAG
jgi:hypothetical protein